MIRWLIQVAVCTLVWLMLEITGESQASSILGYQAQAVLGLGNPEAIATSTFTVQANTQNLRQDEKLDQFWRFQETIRGNNRLAGLFTVYRHDESSVAYLEIQPQQLNQNYLCTITLDSGLGEAGIYQGLSLANFLFYFRRVHNDLQFVVRNLKFRTSPNSPEALAVSRSFSDSVLYSIPIASINPHTQAILINVDDLVLQDIPGLGTLIKQNLQGEYKLNLDNSDLRDISAFPGNVELTAHYTFNAREGLDLASLADDRAFGLQVHYSLVQLPEYIGYIPRLADEKFGYFVSAYQDTSQGQSNQNWVRYINRWFLQPSNPESMLSVPQKPITFWIENTVPVEYREAIKEGVLMWNQAFEKAGFLHALEVRQMPDDADWSPSDLRYNTIRWFNALDAGFARAQMQINPLTGEILGADIILDADMVRSLQQDYLLFHPESSVTRLNNCQDKLDTQDYCYSQLSSFQATIGSLNLSLNPSNSSSEDLQAYIHQYLRALIAHEVGHTLGLRHNFQGSIWLAPHELNNPEITHTKGLVSSVMDYLPVNLAPPGIPQGEYFPSRIGDYDQWAIIYGYQRDFIPENPLDNPDEFLKHPSALIATHPVNSQQPDLGYATDEEIWEINPNVNAWDLSNDVLIYAQWQLENSREIWKRLAQAATTATSEFKDLRGAFNQVLNYYFLNANLLTRYIGGQSLKVSHLEDSYRYLEPVTVEKQRQALTQLTAYIFAESAFEFSPELLNRLVPYRGQWGGDKVPMLRLDYPLHEQIFKVQKTILRSLLQNHRLSRLKNIELKTPPGNALTLPDLFATLTQDIWTEVLDSTEIHAISSLRRALQREHLQILLEMVLRSTEVPEDARTLAWYELKQLEKTMNRKLQNADHTLDLYTKAHLAESCDRITKTLNAQLVSN